MNPPKHPLVRRKYFGKQLIGLGDKLAEVVDKREKSVDFLFRQLDEQQEVSRQVFQAFRQQQLIKEKPEKYAEERKEEWEHVKHQAMIRNDRDCAVCLQSLGDKREKCILNCSHVFHAKCIEAFEYFDVHSDHHCPVCRHHYKKTIYIN